MGVLFEFVGFFVVGYVFTMWILYVVGTHERKDK